MAQHAGEGRHERAQLDVDFQDGHRQVVVTDGQTIDARLRDDNWHRPGPPPPGWVGVDVLEFDTGPDQPR